jgi:hypothetical protein
MRPPVNSGKAHLELAKQGLLLGRGEFSPELASGYLGLNLGPLRCLPPRPVEHAVSRPLADVLVLRREVLLKDAERLWYEFLKLDGPRLGDRGLPRPPA